MQQYQQEDKDPVVYQYCIYTKCVRTYVPKNWLQRVRLVTLGYNHMMTETSWKWHRTRTLTNTKFGHYNYEKGKVFDSYFRVTKQAEIK